ncbi:MAG: hypothetical protein NW207_02290 [Cytophagales bacterium]|nr:hypothetical protein [Cytophagales bacterium]
MPGQIVATTYTGTTVSLMVAYGADRNLASVFDISPQAKATITNALQTSGVSTVNFNMPAVYKITSADESTSNTYLVSVNYANAKPTDILLSANNLNENNLTGYTIGNFSATDPNTTNDHTFMLAAGEGDADNANFTIIGNALKILVKADFETKDTFNIA